MCGAGKTYVGKVMAAALNHEFVDVDKLLYHQLVRILNKSETPWGVGCW